MRFYEKYRIIANEFHRLVSFKKEESFDKFPWRIHESGNKYWIPLPYERENPRKPDFVCGMCNRRYFPRSK